MDSVLMNIVYNSDFFFVVFGMVPYLVWNQPVYNGIILGG